MITLRALPALALAAILASGCAPPWNVVVEAAPNPFFHQGRFGVLPVDFSGLHVGAKTEVEYLTEKDAEQRASFAEDKRALNALFEEALEVRAHDIGFLVVPATGPDAAPFLIRATVTSIEPGFYAPLAAQPSEVVMTVRITAPDGRILDEIRIKHGTQSDMMVHPSSGSRLRADGERLGKIVAEYLRVRIGAAS